MTKPPYPTRDFLASVPLSPEQREAWDDFRALFDTAQAQIHALEKRVKDLEHQTAEPNHPVILTRPEFNREVARMLAFDERYGGTSSVVYFDFDSMDAITARHGKAIANAVMREATDLLIKHVRGSDIIGRLAPNEFGLLLVRCGNADAWKKGKDIADMLARNLTQINGHTLEPQILYGAYTFREKEDVATGLKEVSQMLTQQGAKR